MTNLISEDKKTFTSLELTEQINLFRAEEKGVDFKSLAHADLLKIIRNEFDEEIGQGKISESYYVNSQNKKQPMFKLSFGECKQVLIRESKFVRKQVIKYVDLLESKLREIALHSYQIDDPIKRAERWIEEQKKKQLLENKVDNLNTVLDNLLEWVSILKIAQHNKVSEKVFSWRQLKAKSQELGYQIKKAESPRFGYQNLYHVDAFKAIYPQYNYDLNK
jgi:hypothetical protein